MFFNSFFTQLTQQDHPESVFIAIEDTGYYFNMFDRISIGQKMIKVSLLSDELK